MRGSERTLVIGLVAAAAVCVAVSIPLFLAPPPGYDSDPHVLDLYGAVLLGGGALNLFLPAWVRWGRGRWDGMPPAWLRTPAAAYVTAALLVALAIVLLAITDLPWVAALLPLVPAALYALKGWLSRRRPA